MAGLGRRSHYRKHLTDSVLNDYPEPTFPNQRIAKVVGTRGSNQFELIIAPPILPNEEEEEENDGDINDNNDNNKKVSMELDMTPQLSILPTKYRKLIWLKRNDYVICECATIQDDSSNSNDNNNIKINNNQEEPTNNKNKNDANVKNSANNNNSNNNSNSIEGGIRYMITHILYKDQIKHLKEKNLWPLHSYFNSSNENNNNENEIFIEKAKKILLMKQKNDNYRLDDNDNVEDEEDESNVEVEEEYDEYDNYDDEDNYSEDGIVFSTDNDYFVNTNRIAKLKIDDSSSSDEDSD